MDILKLIREVLRDIDEGHVSTSIIIQKCMRIASIMDDYKALASFKLDLVGSDQKDKSNEIMNEFTFNASKSGLPVEKIKSLWEKLIYDYLNRRSTRDDDGKEAVLILPIIEIEENIEQLTMAIEKNVVPSGLHHLDTLVETQKKNKIDLIYLNSLNRNKSVIKSVKTHLYQFLINKEMEILSMSNEAKITGENSLTVSNKNIFIIHGQNQAKLLELKIMLKDDFKLNPIILSDMPDKGMTIIEKFEFYADQCSYAFALFTPDDIVENNGVKYLQARPNVTFELGWFVSRLGKRNVCVLLQNGKGIEIFSDFQGIIQKRFHSDIKELYRDISLELKDVGLIQ